MYPPHRFTTILIIGSILMVEGGSKVNLCKDITSKSVDLQLKTYLFCDYDSDVRPEGKNKNTTNIGLTIMPKIVDFDDLTDTFNVHTWIVMNWTDYHLTWNPEDFNGVDSLHVSSDDLWVPDITVHNSGDLSKEQSGIPATHCGLSSDGGVMCIPAIKFVTHCDTDYTNYPYDVQNCSIDLAPWAYHSDEVHLFVAHELVMTDYTPNQEWKVVKTSANLAKRDYKLNSNFSTTMYRVQFIFQRRGAVAQVIYIAPAIVLMVMTLCTLWLDCQSNERMIVASICFICHFLCIQDMYFKVPNNGYFIPIIFVFYEKSFLLVTIALILTVLLRELRSLSTTPPEWLASGTSLVLQSKAGQLLLLSILDPKASAFLEASADDNADLVTSGKPDSTWEYLTLLIGWIAFIVIFVVYLILFALYMPTNSIS